MVKQNMSVIEGLRVYLLSEHNSTGHPGYCGLSKRQHRTVLALVSL